MFSNAIFSLQASLNNIPFWFKYFLLQVFTVMVGEQAGKEAVEAEAGKNALKPDYAPAKPNAAAPAGNLLELLDRILDKGVVIIGDIRISVADIELLKVQIRLLIASVDKAKEMGVDFSWAQQIDSKDKETIKALEEKIKKLEEEKA